MMCRALFEGLAGRRLVAQVGTYTHDSWLKMIWAVPQFDDLLLRWGGLVGDQVAWARELTKHSPASCLGWGSEQLPRAGCRPSKAGRLPGLHLLQLSPPC